MMTNSTGNRLAAPATSSPTSKANQYFLAGVCALAGIVLFFAFSLTWIQTDVSCTPMTDGSCVEGLNLTQPNHQIASGIELASGIISIHYDHLEVDFGASVLWAIPVAAFILFFVPLLTQRNTSTARRGFILMMIVATAVLAVVFIYNSRLSQAFSDQRSFHAYDGDYPQMTTTVQAGIGFWLAGVAALTALLCSLVGYFQARRQP